MLRRKEDTLMTYLHFQDFYRDASLMIIIPKSDEQGNKSKSTGFKQMYELSCNNYRVAALLKQLETDNIQKTNNIIIFYLSQLSAIIKIKNQFC